MQDLVLRSSSREVNRSWPEAVRRYCLDPDPDPTSVRAGALSVDLVRYVV